MAVLRCLSLVFTCALVLSSSLSRAENDVSSTTDDGLASFKIEGVVNVVDGRLRHDWVAETKVLVNSGEHVGFLRSNGAFSVNNVPPGSHLVEVVSPNYVFEKIRVDITKTGKIRARRANFIQPTSVVTIPYPLRFHTVGQAPFFEPRETWKLTDHLFNPMVIMMVLPVIFLVLMPRLMSAADPEAQKEMQSQMNMFNQQKQLPEMSDLFANWFSSGKKGGGTGERGLAKKGGRRR